MARLRLMGAEWVGEASNDAECVIIGGGPAGLTAAIYLARFLRACIVIDGGQGRAASIPKSHNLAGFPDGVSGADLLTRMNAQALRHGARIRSGMAEELTREAGGFTVRIGQQLLRTPTVLIATGVVNHRPAMPPAVHDTAISQGLIRYCPVCDGFEARGMRIAVLGCDAHGAGEAEFLCRYGKRITLLAQNTIDLLDDDRSRLKRLGVEIAESPVRALRIDGPHIIAELERGGELRFDTLYPALGTSPRNRLAAAVGAQVAEDGCILTDEHQQTNVPGLFAAGDVVEGLDQISVAMGQAAKAATAIHNMLRERDEALGAAVGGLSAPSTRSEVDAAEGKG